MKARGKPLYHGSPAKEPFKTFDLTKAGSSDKGFAGKGIYLTDDYDAARYFADEWTSKAAPVKRTGSIIEAYADIKNPLIIGSGVKSPYADLQKILGVKDSASIPEALKRKGFDSIIIEGVDDAGRTANEIVLFDTNQVKTKSSLIDLWNKAQK